MGAQPSVIMEEAMESLNMEERSNLEERKHEIQKEYKAYMVEHPELRQALNDFLTALLAERPDNIYKFARYWFSTSLPPLRPLTAKPPKAPAAGAAPAADAAPAPAPVSAPAPAATSSEQAAPAAPAALNPEQQTEINALMDKYDGADTECVESAMAKFTEFDMNGDGVLVVTEFRRKLADWGMDGANLHLYLGGGKRADGILDDHVIKVAEFVQWYFAVVLQLNLKFKDDNPQVQAVLDKYADSLQSKHLAEANANFNQLDVNHSGSVSLMEFRAKLEQWGMDGTAVRDYLGGGAMADEILDDKLVEKHEFYDWYFSAQCGLAPK